MTTGPPASANHIRLRGYLLAGGSVAVVVVLAIVLRRFVEADVSPLYLAAVMLSAWRGGLGAGLLATALAAFLDTFFSRPPLYSPAVDTEDLFEVGAFTLAAIVISSMSAARKAALVREQVARHSAETANAAKDEFIAAVSHELRTPLTTIKTLTRVLLRKNPAEHERNAYLEDIASECDRQIDLVHNLLDMSRLRAGGVQMTPRRVDAREVVQACEAIVRVEAAERKHQLLIDVPSTLPFVRADYSALRRALCTIVENAIKYTRDGGRIVIRGRQDGGGGVAIDVEDTGRGIHEDDLSRIFDSFYRGRVTPVVGDGVATSEPDVPGIGLGLHLARALVEGMGGGIDVRSRVGHGSTFTVRIPVWRDDGDGGVVNDRPERGAAGRASSVPHG